MTQLTLITTLYALEPVLVCVTRLSPSKIIILTEDGVSKEKVQAENTIEATFGNVIEIEKKVTSLYDPITVAQDVSSLIEKEHSMNRKITINVSGGRKPQAFGALFGAYARSDMVKRIVYVTEEDHLLIDFPILSFNISSTKKQILELIQNGVNSVTLIAEELDISKGMTYNHVRELKAMGYIYEDNGFSITDSGKLAAI
ncbi:CRISPR locus-related DNA-binding protein [Methanosalsum zhilinae DSM 4017]|uniref:CRISPR locus-related DNA-binding protein n=1 Tax=Methanosalsum zhilinae (strain DSM 4017 / NBRC 107636 / OCM 62 / WeN5) TaxID=679901 RepID=F7XNG3_METZD|nr:CRISPR-associated CARF protein Csa3 [Methanosalsum zhilinae]AEH61215.1 CRISPR locus-related DNA-binding protein [Methanosalsum zhilinae DSM 4017]